MSQLSAVFGCAGPTLSPEEAAFFRETQPWGFILFGRNIETPEQVRRLVGEMRAAVGEAAPVLIDQEGGRVQRLRPPHWARYPPGWAYTALDVAIREEIAWLGGRLIAHDLLELGVNVDCAPVLDVPQPGAHEVIGDRAYGDAPGAVATIGRAFADGLLSGGVLPVMKHIPGHGRALADSHERLPVVSAGLEELRCDFAPFRANADLPAAMTSHVVYAAIDGERPATTSAAVIGSVVRAEIGFDGLLFTDDLSMKALCGDLASRAQNALAVGCDIVLHCNGDMDEMSGVASGARSLAGDSLRRTDAALARIAKGAESFDVGAARTRFAAAFEALRTA
ncbi:MAG TPA: beta-N-acetylhexosaminidase [Caulobacteraceae bacterium]|nr:beta-N-acetylhexosaminidase [Caulobacteraceae bacterium]